MLVVDGQGFAIDGVDRPRGTNEVIIYSKGAVADVNMWGTDVAIVNGRVTQVVARERDRIPNQTSIPAGGVVVVELVGAQFELQWNVGPLGQTAGDRADRSLLLGRRCRRVFSLG